MGGRLTFCGWDCKEGQRDDAASQSAGESADEARLSAVQARRNEARDSQTTRTARVGDAATRSAIAAHDPTHRIEGGRGLPRRQSLKA